MKDLGPKLRLYARYGIGDYLVVNLDSDLLLHHHESDDFGYRGCDALGESDVFTPQRSPKHLCARRHF